MARDDEADEHPTGAERPSPTGGVISGPDGLEVFEQVKIAMRITAELNTMVTDDLDEIRRVFSRLVGKSVDDTFMLMPPFYTNYGLNICVGKNVFVNHACSFIDLGGITIADDVMIGPRVNLVTAGHPTEPSARRRGIVHRPITIERNAWIGAAATILAGVTVGENSIVAAGAVVTKDVPANCMVAGVPARVMKTTL